MTGFNNKTEERHPNHGTGYDGKPKKSGRCRKCMLGDNYGM